MVTFIRLYPIFAICISLIMLDLARNLRRKGKPWLPLLIFSVVLLGSIALWWNYQGYRNAERWVKEWASLTFAPYTHSV